MRAMNAIPCHAMPRHATNPPIILSTGETGSRADRALVEYIGPFPGSAFSAHDFRPGARLAGCQATPAVSWRAEQRDDLT